jgi:hypothetical protein
VSVVQFETVLARIILQINRLVGIARVVEGRLTDAFGQALDQLPGLLLVCAVGESVYRLRSPADDVYRCGGIRSRRSYFPHRAGQMVFG